MSAFPIFRSVNRFVVIPTLGFSLGVATFIKGWPDESDSLSLPIETRYTPTAKGSKQSLYLQRTDILDKIAKLPLYKQLINDPNFDHGVQSEGMPAGHRFYHVGQGQLFGPSKLEIDPIVFRNTKEGSLVIFYHLGNDLSNENGKVHKGILSLLLDEGLCYCGFPKLPSKRGVTARLSVNFEKDLPLDSTIILRAKVTESKDRKCIIDGSLESVPRANLIQTILGQTPTEGTVFARSTCILVEPKWFKYFSWLNVFE